MKSSRMRRRPAAAVVAVLGAALAVGTGGFVAHAAAPRPTPPPRAGLTPRPAPSATPRARLAPPAAAATPVTRAARYTG